MLTRLDPVRSFDNVSSVDAYLEHALVGSLIVLVRGLRTSTTNSNA